MAERIVVSDSGEVWSPKIAPARTAPNAGISKVRSTVATISAAIGRISPNVPNVLPIEKEMNEASRNKIAGSNANAVSPLIQVATYSPIPSER